jgi:hypothetical protein
LQNRFPYLRNLDFRSSSPSVDQHGKTFPVVNAPGDNRKTGYGEAIAFIFEPIDISCFARDGQLDGTDQPAVITVEKRAILPQRAQRVIQIKRGCKCDARGKKLRQK